MTVAVAHYYPFIRPGGGPAGYLFNLRLGLVGHPSRGLIEIVTSSESSQRPWSLANPPLRAEEKWGTLRGHATRNTLRRTLAAWHVASRWRFGRLPPEVRNRLALYPVVVFHDVRHAHWYLRAGGGSPAQQVFIALHSLMDAASEDVCRLSAEYGEAYDWSPLRSWLRQAECDTYWRARGLIVPHRETLDKYFDGAARLQDEFSKMRFFEILAGVEVLTPKVPRDVARSQLGVVGRQMLVAYLGPRDRSDGFGAYLEVGREAERRYPGRFAFIGREVDSRERESLLGRQDANWSAGHFGDYVNAADIVLVPKSCELLDLEIVEAMSMGKVVVTSATGGNRWLARLTQGVVVTDCGAVTGPVERLVELTKLGKLRLLGRQNFDTYVARFTLEGFVRRHLDFASEALTMASGKAR